VAGSLAVLRPASNVEHPNALGQLQNDYRSKPKDPQAFLRPFFVGSTREGAKYHQGFARRLTSLFSACKSRLQQSQKNIKAASGSSSSAITDFDRALPGSADGLAFRRTHHLIGPPCKSFTCRLHRHLSAVVERPLTDFSPYSLDQSAFSSILVDPRTAHFFVDVGHEGGPYRSKGKNKTSA
jgi:hypothetical protein